MNFFDQYRRFFFFFYVFGKLTLNFRNEFTSHFQLRMESVEYIGNMDEQGGGHGGIRRCTVQPGDHAAISKPLNHCEEQAYKDLQNTPLKEFIPEFFGVQDENGSKNLIISDLTAGFESVCLADFKIGRRHYDLDATEEKKNNLIKKQRNSTTDSLGVRLIDAKIRHGGEVVKAWDRKQGLQFSYDELQEVFDMFVPPELKEEFKEKCDKIYGAYEKTLEENPGFRMYAGSLLIAYDGEKKDDLRLCLIDLAHTHLDITKDHKCDVDDEEYDDGVLQGLASLLNFAESSHDVPLHDKGQVEYQVVDDGEVHKEIQRCIVNPGNHHCIIRPNDPNETAAITLLNSTALQEFIPKLFDISNNKAIVEDIGADFQAMCVADFKVGTKSYDVTDEEETIQKQRKKDNHSTTAKYGVRLVMAKGSGKEWKRKENDNVNATEENLTTMIHQFAEEDLRKRMAEELVKLRDAYQATLADYPNFRIYDASVLVIYDAANSGPTGPIRCALTKLGETHLDITKEGLKVSEDLDDGFLTGLQNLISYFSPEVALNAPVKERSASSSKCCLLL